MGMHKKYDACAFMQRFHICIFTQRFHILYIYVQVSYFVHLCPGLIICTFMHKFHI